MGPLLFCLAVHPLLSGSKAEFRIGYLDDITLGGKMDQIAADVNELSIGAAKLGLQLNAKKCEAIYRDHLPCFSAPSPGSLPSRARMLGC